MTRVVSIITLGRNFTAGSVFQRTTTLLSTIFMPRCVEKYILLHPEEELNRAQLFPGNPQSWQGCSDNFGELADGELRKHRVLAREKKSNRKQEEQWAIETKFI